MIDPKKGVVTRDLLFNFGTLSVTSERVKRDTLFFSLLHKPQRVGLLSNVWQMTPKWGVVRVTCPSF